MGLFTSNEDSRTDHSSSLGGLRRSFVTRTEHCVCALALCALTASAPAAQEFRGAITGRINDRSGGRLPGVTVTATNVATRTIFRGTFSSR